MHPPSTHTPTHEVSDSPANVFMYYFLKTHHTHIHIGCTHARVCHRHVHLPSLLSMASWQASRATQPERAKASHLLMLCTHTYTCTLEQSSNTVHCTLLANYYQAYITVHACHLSNSDWLTTSILTHTVKASHRTYTSTFLSVYTQCYARRVTCTSQSGNAILKRRLGRDRH